MKKRKCIAWLLSIMLVLTMVPEMSFAQEEVITEDNVTEAAAIEKTENTTTYQLSDGSNMTVFYGGDVRFADEKGSLVDYDPSLVRVKTDTSENGNLLEGYAYENKEGDSRQYMPENLSEDTPVLMEKGGYTLALSMSKESLEGMGADGARAAIKSIFVCKFVFQLKQILNSMQWRSFAASFGC